MIEVVFGPDEPVADFVAKLIPGCERGFERPRSFGVLSNNRLVGGVIFTNWQPEAGTIELHAAATTRRWLTAPVIRTVFGYVFDRCECQMAILRVAEGNEAMRSIARRLGFSEHVIPRLFGRDQAGIVYTLTEEQWRASRFERAKHHVEA